MSNGRGRAGSARADLRTFARLMRRLPGFLRATLSEEEARGRVARQLEQREQSFARVLADGVYGNPRSPYRPLLEACGAELGDVLALVRRDGVEAALSELREAGVYVSLDEFKGRRPIERPGVSVEIDDRSFESPLSTAHLRGSTGGSRGSPRRVSFDLDLLEHEAAYHALFRSAFGLWDRPFALWRVVPPSASGLNNSMRQVKLGRPVARWFNPHRPGLDSESLKFALFTRLTITAGRACGSALRHPEYCAPEDAGRVARWLSEQAGAGTPAVLDTQAALGVRVCLAAAAEGLDISGTFFRFGGEPYTEAKARVVAESGSTAVCHYTMGETGRIGVACAEGSALDDVHLVTDKLAVLQHDRAVGTAGARIGALSYTTLLPSATKLMINVESDDYGVLEDRPCGCPFGQLGFTRHLHGIRSHEKLTSEGNHFLGSDLYALVDEVLPRRFGGSPTDYQLVEEEETSGLPRVTVAVGPSIGPVDDEEVVAAVIDYLRAEPRNRLMAEVWREGRTLRVERREPLRTSPSGKILPLHTTGSR